MKIDNNWRFNQTPVDEIPDGFTAFVYQIMNRRNHKKYIGCKLAKRMRKLKPLKGSRKVRYRQYDTDWRSYWGSNKKLLHDKAQSQEHYFVREIICYCHTLNEAKYIECKIQMEKDVLLRPDEYYNAMVNIRMNRSHVPDLMMDKQVQPAPPSSLITPDNPNPGT